MDTQNSDDAQNARRSRRHRRRPAWAATGVGGAASLALALTASLAVTSPAAGTPAGGGTAQPGPQRVTLITGDQVLLDAEGSVIGLVPAEGREDVPYSVRESGESLYVIPLDAAPVIERGLVDQRLFDVAELNRPEYDQLAGDGDLSVIVAYDDGAGRADRLYQEAGSEPEVRAELESVDGQALTLDADAAAATWESLTGPGPQSASASAATSAANAAGVSWIRLDGIREAALDVSVPRIGAPTAWEAGYDGEGVTIAVLDTGIDATHPDLADGKVVAAENFSFAPDTEDRSGHGTHVASIAAGTGAASDGAYTGVAPQARLLNGKVLDDNGFGFDSDVIAGMEWAAAQGADIVNLSLGSVDTRGIDPVEEAVNRLSADGGPLFVVAAGNEGRSGSGTVGSPASADAALAVGAVDQDDQLADFSSRGPRVGDGAVKPELTAPGVSIGAAAAEGSEAVDRGEPVADGYVGLSGTSMAAPHVAGAAALLAQRHPEWSGEQIRAALVASTELVAGHSPFEQGTGRLDVAAAMDQTVIAEPVTLGFGAAAWPHEDSEPVTEELTYRNLGTEDAVLDLAVTGFAPGGGPAPEGMFTADATSLTVPAGGTAAVQVTADPALGADGPLGSYSSYVTAVADDGQTVRTAGAVDLPGETYELTVEGRGLDGAADSHWGVTAMNHETGELLELGGPADGSARTDRLPAGDWIVNSMYQHIDATGSLTEVVVQTKPLVELTEDTTVVFDAGEAELVAPTVAEGDAQLSNLAVELRSASGMTSVSIGSPQRIGLRTQDLGPELPAERVQSQLLSSWDAGEDTEYHALEEWTGGFFTGHAAHYDDSRFAEANVGIGAASDETSGQLIVRTGHDGQLGSYGPSRDLPRTASVRVTPGDWAFDLFFFGSTDHGHLTLAPQRFEEGETYDQLLNVGVFGPHLSEGIGLHRTGDTLYVHNHLLDGWAADGAIGGESGTMTLRRDGEVVGTADSYAEGWFELPASEATYELTATAWRSGSVSTEITTSHTFTSATVPDDDFQELPSSVVRFSPRLALDSTAPEKERMVIPVTVAGAAGDGNLAKLTVQQSFDGGETWRRTPVRLGAITVTNPAAGNTVSLRAEVTDKDGNTTTQTIIDAYQVVAGGNG